MSAMRLLPQKQVAKVWGRTDLPAPFSAPNGERIGEIWFEPPPECHDLLVKYLFTDDRLSVQVHPSDAQAREGDQGKEECWYILDADPGAMLAIGLVREVSEDELRAAALDGSIEGLLEWHSVQAGDFFYLPAGTIHAIGPGLSLVEVQQNSDTTYRLYDYGRPRDLHLDAALAVADRHAHDPKHRRAVPSTGDQQLVQGPHFRFDRLVGEGCTPELPDYEGSLLVAPLNTGVTVEGEGIPAGSCALVQDKAALSIAKNTHALVMQAV